MSGDLLRVVIAEDDEDDQLLIRRAVERSGCPFELHFVSDGERLIEHLGDAANAGRPTSYPDLVVIDLNMPRVDGFEALGAIKNHPDLRSLPVVILTTSERPDDILGAYRAGASSYFTKPCDLPGLTTLMEELASYWHNVVRLPQREASQ